MLRTTHATALAALVALASCTKTSDNPPTVTAPVVSGTPRQSTPPVASASPASGGDADTANGDDMTLGPGPANDTSADAGNAQYRACQQDSDCTAVPRVACCNNGWHEAINATQKDAYAKSFVCPVPHPMCPMYIVRDTRVPKCDAATHLCTMVRQ